MSFKKLLGLYGLLVYVVVANAALLAGAVWLVVKVLQWTHVL